MAKANKVSNQYIIKRGELNKVSFVKDLCIIQLLDKNNKDTYCILDTEDYVKLPKVRWHNNQGYAYNTRLGALHTFVLPSNKIIDHINRDTLDNRKQNLREANKALNSFNRKLNSNSKSGFQGVSFDKKSKTWEAYICPDYSKVSLGKYDNKYVAKAVRDAIYELYEVELLTKV